MKRVCSLRDSEVLGHSDSTVQMSQEQRTQHAGAFLLEWAASARLTPLGCCLVNSRCLSYAWPLCWHHVTLLVTVQAQRPLIIVETVSKVEHCWVAATPEDWRPGKVMWPQWPHGSQSRPPLEGFMEHIELDCSPCCCIDLSSYHPQILQEGVININVPLRYWKHCFSPNIVYENVQPYRNIKTIRWWTFRYPPPGFHH